MAKTSKELLEELLTQYDALGGYYASRREDERRQIAEKEYQSYYDQLRLTAQQQQERSDLALQQQREGLQATYDKQREASAKDYAKTYSQADQQMLKRGMQRSTYAAQTLANIGQKGAEAQQELWEAQGTAESNIDAQRAQLTRQLADQLAQYEASKAADVMNRIRELEEQDYSRAVDNFSLRNQIGANLYTLLKGTEQSSSGGSNKQGDKDKQSDNSAGSQSVGQLDYNSFLRLLNEGTVTPEQLLNPNVGTGSTGSGGVTGTKTKTISGPINQAFLESLNKVTPYTGVTYESELQNALKKKKDKRQEVLAQ